MREAVNPFCLPLRCKAVARYSTCYCPAGRVYPTDINRLDGGVEGSGMWLFLIGGEVFLQFMYTVLCTLFPLVAEICARLAGSFCQYFTTVTSGQIVWFGWLSAISQLASRVGEVWGVGKLCFHTTLHYIVQVAIAGRGVAFPPPGLPSFS